jgi:hypothetical protein
MNKTQVIWLIIRLIGVYVLYLGVLSFFSLAGSVPGLYTLPKLEAPNKNANVTNPNVIRPVPIPQTGANDQSGAEPTPTAGKSDEDSITAKFKGKNFTNFLYYLIVTAIYGVLAWYLIRDGRILFAVLNRERQSGPENEREPEVTTLNL